MTISGYSPSNRIGNDVTGHVKTQGNSKTYFELQNNSSHFGSSRPSAGMETMEASNPLGDLIDVRQKKLHSMVNNEQKSIKAFGPNEIGNKKIKDSVHVIDSEKIKI